MSLYSNNDYHIEHCSTCFSANCQLDRCELQHCPECGVRLHECKLDDHLENICPKVILPCINSNYGCDRKLRRHLQGKHLKSCPASLVVCTREWNRQVLSSVSKVELKKLGKTHAKLPHLTDELATLDLIAARSDQKLIMESYSYSRAYRNNQRTKLHPAHPMLPLRCVHAKSDNDGEHSANIIEQDDEDSSEAENKEKHNRLRKKRAMFANCYQCQIDPSTQHLHTLGNVDSKFKKLQGVKKYPEKDNEILRQASLMINAQVECVPEIPKSENIRAIARGGTIYTRRCLHVFRRDEYADHQESQHLNSLNSLSELVVRCPNWSRGCSFTCSRLKPKLGKIHFSQYLNSFVTLKSENTNAISSSTTLDIDKISCQSLDSILKYLPSNSVRSLSQSCTSFRNRILQNAENRGMIEVVWKKVNSRWIEDGTKFSFSIADNPVEMEWKPAHELGDHLSNCDYRDIYKMTKDRVTVLFREYFHEHEVPLLLDPNVRTSYNMIMDDMKALRPPEIPSENY